MNHSDMQAIARGLAPVVHDHVTKALAPIEKRLAEAESRLAEMEKGGVRFRGVHQRATSYRRGDQVTFKGSLWACVADETDAVPGDGPDWQLCAKGSK